MKKRLSFVATAVLLFMLFSVPAFAVEWPPKNYEMPRTVLTPDIAGDALSGLFLSIKAMGNTGLIILGITLSFSLIQVIFNRLFLDKIRILRGVQKNEFRRSVQAADRARNMNAIVDNRVAEMEISQKARQKFRQLHPDADFEERLYQRQLSHSVDMEFRRLNPGLEVDQAVHRREVSLQADGEFQRMHPGLDVDRAVHRREVAHQAAETYRNRYPDEELEDAVQRYDLNRKAKGEYWRRKGL